jgi:hypothetical protein
MTKETYKECLRYILKQGFKKTFEYFEYFDIKFKIYVKDNMSMRPVYEYNNGDRFFRGIELYVTTKEVDLYLVLDSCNEIKKCLWVLSKIKIEVK